MQERELGNVFYDILVLLKLKTGFSRNYFTLMTVVCLFVWLDSNFYASPFQL